MLEKAGANDVFTDEMADAFADLKLDNDVCKLNLKSCENQFEKSLANPDALSWYQDPAAVAGIGAAAFVLGFIVGSTAKK